MITAKESKRNGEFGTEIKANGDDITILKEFTGIIVALVRDGIPIETLIQCMENARQICKEYREDIEDVE